LDVGALSGAGLYEGPAMASHWFDWGRASIHYTKSGWGDPLLLIHDLYGGASSEEFDRNVRFLNQHFTVYRLDLVGFGLSDGHAFRYRWQHYANLIGDFCREVIGAPAHVAAVGQSCGFVAAAAVGEPELFGKLAFIAPEVLAHQASQWRRTSRFLREAMWLALLTPPMRAVFREVMAGEWEQGEFLRRTVFDTRCVDQSTIDRLGEIAWERHALPAYASLEAGFLSTAVEDFLPHLAVPVRFICGAECDSEYLHRVDRLAGLVSGSVVDRVGKARFWPHYEQPRVMNPLLASFLGESSFGQSAGSGAVAA
jgi:pimeloyl-ACP methyl ester carboxylesterase